MNLLESYKGRLAISEKYYAQKNEGAKMSNTKKMLTAQCLHNTATFLNEAFKVAAGTQRADLGMYKTFCMDITALAVPNFIVDEIFMVAPMSSFTGYITYMEYALGEPKGGAGGELEDAPFTSAMSRYDQSAWNVNNKIMSPFAGFGKMDENRVRYSGQAVVEVLKEDSEGGLKLSWTPVLKAENMDELDTEGNPGVVEVDAEGNILSGAADGDRIRYIYDNQYIPQEKLPSVVARMQGVALTAKARRLAVEYSQFAAFQAKQDYGMDFESTIAQQAQAELEYEIDSEAVFLVKETADELAANDPNHLVKWIDEELDTISYSMKAEGFARKLEQAKAIVYKATGRFMPNWMLVSPDVMPILTFVKGFNASNNTVANGPYVAGTVAGMKVIVSPILGEKVCYLGVLGADGKTAVGVYAPYMPIVPTQLLGFADGRMSQGFSTLYDMKIINPLLLSKIEIIDGNNSARYNLFEGEEAEI